MIDELLAWVDLYKPNAWWDRIAERWCVNIGLADRAVGQTDNCFTWQAAMDLARTRYPKGKVYADQKAAR